MLHKFLFMLITYNMTSLIILTLELFKISNIFTRTSASLPIEAKTPPNTKQNRIKPRTFKLLRPPAVAL